MDKYYYGRKGKKRQGGNEVRYQKYGIFGENSHKISLVKTKTSWLLGMTK